MGRQPGKSTRHESITHAHVQDASVLGEDATHRESHTRRLPLQPRHMGCHGAQQDSAAAVLFVELVSRQWSYSGAWPLIGVVDDCASRLFGRDAQVPARNGLVKRLERPRLRTGRKVNPPPSRAAFFFWLLDRGCVSKASTSIHLYLRRRG